MRDQGRQQMDWPIDSVRAANGKQDPVEVLQQSTSVLLGVSAAAAAALANVGIATVFDLASSELFTLARNIILLAEDGQGSLSGIGRVPRDALRTGRDLSLAELSAAPVSTLASSISPGDMDTLAQTLDVASI